jgi:hypothetical protein
MTIRELNQKKEEVRHLLNRTEIVKCDEITKQEMYLSLEILESIIKRIEEQSKKIGGRI